MENFCANNAFALALRSKSLNDDEYNQEVIAVALQIIECHARLGHYYISSKELPQSIGRVRFMALLESLGFTCTQDLWQVQYGLFDISWYKKDDASQAQKKPIAAIQWAA